MKWPERPTCHDPARAHWVLPREESDVAYRRCSACGSTHPQDLVRLFGTTDAPMQWRNVHLLDRGYDEAAITLLVHILHERRARATEQNVRPRKPSE